MLYHTITLFSLCVLCCNSYVCPSLKFQTQCENRDNIQKLKQHKKTVSKSQLSTLSEKKYALSSALDQSHQTHTHKFFFENDFSDAKCKKS